MTSAARRLRRAARKDVGAAAPVAATPGERFAKRIAAALAELGASGANPVDAVAELVTFAAEFAAFHGIEEKDFVAEAAIEHHAAVAKIAEAKK